MKEVHVEKWKPAKTFSEFSLIKKIFLIFYLVIGFLMAFTGAALTIVYVVYNSERFQTMWFFEYVLLFLAIVFFANLFYWTWFFLVFFSQKIFRKLSNQKENLS